MNTVILLSVLVLLNCGLWIICSYHKKPKQFKLTKDQMRLLKNLLHDTEGQFREEFLRLARSDNKADQEKFLMIRAKLSEIAFHNHFNQVIENCIRKEVGLHDTDNE